mmetsp:Transcript_39286/g.81534  ORF Transcript_39286/g.81534 Transcript_39286/m.81534 type:complete len:204 (+) Transcript_39286:1071-1682(+)
MHGVYTTRTSPSQTEIWETAWTTQTATTTISHQTAPTTSFCMPCTVWFPERNRSTHQHQLQLWHPLELQAPQHSQGDHSLMATLEACLVLEATQVAMVVGIVPGAIQVLAEIMRRMKKKTRRKRRMGRIAIYKGTRMNGSNLSWRLPVCKKMRRNMNPANTRCRSRKVWFSESTTSVLESNTSEGFFLLFATASNVTAHRSRV